MLISIAVLENDANSLSRAVHDWLAEEGYGDVLDYITVTDQLTILSGDRAPDIVVICKGWSELCEPYFEANPNGLVVHVEEGLFMQPHAASMLNSLARHCTIYSADWQSALADIFKQYFELLALKSSSSEEIRPDLT